MVRVSASESTLFDRGEGACTPIADTKKGKDSENLKRHWYSKCFWQ